MNNITLNNIKEPSYLVREAINQLKTNIEFSGDDINTLLVTSSGPNEGKSTIAFELAKSFAEEGKHVCYVDADLRKSVFNTRYQIKAEQQITGLSNILSRSPNASDAICKTNLPNLFVILSGHLSPDPTTLFKGERMSQLLTLLKEHFDYAIIDIAPLGAVIDAAVVAPKCDGTLLVVANNETSARVARRVKKQLEMANARILGVVFNKVEVSNNKYYYYYGEKGKARK